MSLRNPASAGGNGETEYESQRSLARSLIGFLDKNLKNFSPGVRDAIGLGILLILASYVLHGLVGPTYVGGQLFVIDANGERGYARGWNIEYDNQNTISNNNGAWTLPVRLGGIPGQLRVNLSGPDATVETVPFFGPWPIWTALKPMVHTIVLDPSKPPGHRIIEVSESTIVVPNRDQTVFAQNQGRAADQPASSTSYGCEISIDAVKVNKFPGFFRSSGRAYFTMYLDGKRVDDDLLYNAIVAAPDQHFPVQSNNEVWMPVDSGAAKRYKGFTGTLLPVADCSGTTSDVMRIIPRGKVTLKMFLDNGTLIDTFDLGPVLQSPGKVIALNGNETGNATVSFHATAHASTTTFAYTPELSPTALETGRKASSPDMKNDQAITALYIGHDPGKAMKLLMNAAAAGSKEGMYNLGAFYEGGLNGPKNFQQARQWYEKAAALGDKLAQERLKQLPQ